MERSVQKPEPRRRRRPALSCIECRRRKIKCDRTEPCRNCVSTDSQCTYSRYRSAVNTRHPHGSHQGSPGDSRSSLLDHAPHSSPQGEQNSTESQGLGNTLHFSRPELVATRNSTQDAGPSNGVFPSNRSQDLEQRLQNLTRRLQKLEESGTNLTHKPSDTVLTCQSGLQESRLTIEKTRISKWGLWATMTQKV